MNLLGVIWFVYNIVVILDVCIDILFYCIIINNNKSAIYAILAQLLNFCTFK